MNLSARKLARRLSATLLAALASVGAHGLEEDRLQEIVIQSQSATLDEQSGVITYEGSVTLTQGSLELSAEILLAKREQGQVVEIAASKGDASEQVSYAQIIRSDRPEVTAFANEMTYNLRAQTIHLTGDAALSQGEIKFQGNSILYNIALGKTEASGDVTMELPAQTIDTFDLDGDERQASETP